MLKHCVLSVDYGEGWEEMLGHLPAALALLGVEKLTLVYVKETHHQQHVEDTDGLAESHLKDLSGKLAAELQVEVDYQLRHGFPASELVDVAYTIFANMVMVLNRSHSATREVLRGNVALNLARISTLPVMVLPMDGEPADPKGTIMLSVDGSQANKAAQNCFRSLMDKGHSGVVAWVQNAEHDDSGVLQSLSNEYHHVSARILKGSPGKALVQAAGEENVSLLIIGKRGVTPINELILGSVAEYVVRESLRPVLLVP
jgi:nucleotide-binding universal stress UspA family protein